jgi:hypothetical protein
MQNPLAGCCASSKILYPASAGSFSIICLTDVMPRLGVYWHMCVKPRIDLYAMIEENFDPVPVVIESPIRWLLLHKQITYCRQ